METVPVRICKAQNDHYDKHEDADFCFSQAEDLNVLGSIRAEEAVIVSPDDKAIVKLGVVAAKMQTAIVMHLEYKLRLPNHDFIVANKHHLIPSVYAFLNINNKNIGRSTAVSGKGPTAVFIRSG